ncbi:DUF6586 family protein [Aquiflexum gelatinilyticum]|uniref:DUF6586 family protein n=1 Tax=Aquiflexum gelatinilyticum TaxID=2961943 RepID=UPI00216A646D|nr:DUF6586 family protein [Aquiflexum gelatinilyticum]MCS4436308.1 hypothetical protein [Aquiflexum gelatinilyticum]
MKMKKYSPLKEHTDAKLRYAQLYLDALKEPKVVGSDLEKAHQGSFLFHLNGVVDAFLAEINELYGLGLKGKHLTIDHLKSAKPESKKSLKEVKKLGKLLGKKNWLAELRSFDPNNVKPAKKGKKSEVDKEVSNLVEHVVIIPTNPIMERFEDWQAKMRRLISELRESALLGSGKAPKK